MVMHIATFKNFFKQLGIALKLLIKNDPLRLAAATAFFATFALPFILIILIEVLGVLFTQRSVSHELFLRLSEMLGHDSVQQVAVIIGGFRRLVTTWWAITAGSLFMLFVATTLFRVIKNSFNQLWMIRITARRAFRMTIISRVRSLIIILFTGFLFLTGVLIEGLRVLFGRYISEVLPKLAIVFNGITSILISLLIAMVWFATLIHYVAEGRPSWKVTFMSAFVTAALFTLGKFILRWLLIDSNIQQIFGASGSFVLLLLFVFYSAMILYYGAAFTKVWGIHQKKPMRILPHAKLFELHDVGR
jgi:membrane protein